MRCFVSWLIVTKVKFFYSSYTGSVLVTLTLQHSYISFLFGMLEINLIGESLIENTLGQEKLSSSPAKFLKANYEISAE